MDGTPSGLNYPGNSNKKKAEGEAKAESKRKKLPKSISGDVVYRKKKTRSKIAESFMGDDTRSVGHYILFEVVLPAIKQLISDAASQGVERLLFGDSSRSNTRVGSRPGYTSYNRINVNRRDEPRAISQRARASHDFSEIILKSRDEAEKVRDDLTACVDQYDVATVSDLYDLVGISGSFQDDKWGWYDLRDVRIRRVREGYLLELPRTQPIE